MSHKWDHANEQRIAGHACPDGNSRNVKYCEKCKLIMTTVIPPYGTPWHEYTFPNGGETVRSEKRPPCHPVREVVGV